MTSSGHRQNTVVLAALAVLAFTALTTVNTWHEARVDKEQERVYLSNDVEASSSSSRKLLQYVQLPPNITSTTTHGVTLDLHKTGGQIQTWQRYYNHRQTFSGRRVGKNFRPYFEDYQQSILLVGFAGFTLAAILALVGVCWWYVHHVLLPSLVPWTMDESICARQVLVTSSPCIHHLFIPLLSLLASSCNRCAYELIRKLTYQTFRPRASSIFSNYETFCSQVLVWLLFIGTILVTGYAWWGSIEAHGQLDTFIQDSRDVADDLVSSIRGVHTNYTSSSYLGFDFARPQHVFELTALTRMSELERDAHRDFLSRGHEYEMVRYVMLFCEGILAIVAICLGVQGVVSRDTRPLYKMGVLAWIMATFLWALFAGHQEMGTMGGDWCAQAKPFVLSSNEARVPFMNEAGYQCLDEYRGYGVLAQRRLVWSAASSVQQLKQYIESASPLASITYVGLYANETRLMGSLNSSRTEVDRIQMVLTSLEGQQAVVTSTQGQQLYHGAVTALTALHTILDVRACGPWRVLLARNYEDICYLYLDRMEHVTAAVAVLAVLMTLMICAAPCAINRIPERTDFNTRDLQMTHVNPYAAGAKGAYPPGLDSSLPPITTMDSHMSSCALRTNITEREKALGGHGFYDLHGYFSTIKPGGAGREALGRSPMPGTAGPGALNIVDSGYRGVNTATSVRGEAALSQGPGAAAVHTPPAVVRGPVAGSTPSSAQPLRHGMETGDAGRAYDYHNRIPEESMMGTGARRDEDNRRVLDIIRGTNSGQGPPSSSSVHTLGRGHATVPDRTPMRPGHAPAPTAHRGAAAGPPQPLSLQYSVASPLSVPDPLPRHHVEGHDVQQPHSPHQAYPPYVYSTTHSPIAPSGPAYAPEYPVSRRGYIAGNPYDDEDYIPPPPIGDDDDDDVIPSPSQDRQLGAGYGGYGVQRMTSSPASSHHSTVHSPAHASTGSAGAGTQPWNTIRTSPSPYTAADTTRGSPSILQRHHSPVTGTKYSPHKAPVIMRLTGPPIVQEPGCQEPVEL